MSAATMKRLMLVVFLLSACIFHLSASAEEVTKDGELPVESEPAFSRLMQTKMGDSLVSRLSESGRIPVIISLANQPSFRIAMDVQARYRNELQANQEQIQKINRKYSTDRRPANAAEAARFAREEWNAVTAQDRLLIRNINAQSKETKDRMRREIMEQARLAVAMDQSIVTGFIQSLGGTISYTFDIENAIAARVPGTALRSIADHPLVRFVIEDELRGAHLDVSGPTAGAQAFWNVGETGGIWWNATCDTGVDTSHPALSGKTWWQGVFHATASGWSGYNDNSTSTDDLQSHGTHVAGIANSTDSTYRGISYGSTRSTNLKAGFRANDGKGYMYDSDGMAAVHWGFTNATMDVINLSFGGDTTDDDNGYVRFWDAVVDAKSTAVAISAGNSGPGDNTLGSPSIFWNGLCVANVSDNNTTNRNDDVISSSSSRGPTANGRKKPDISAPGSGILSTSNTWEGAGSDFVSKGGTSMASPHVAGAATLLHDIGIYDPKLVKAILINTADFIQGATSWTNQYGWGYLNLDTAYLRRTNWFSDSVSPNGTSGSYRLYRVPSPQVGDKVTMVWNRHVNYNNADVPTTWYNLNDLNLRFYVEGNNASHATSLSGIDNVEQVVSGTTQPLVIRAYAWSAAFNGVSTEPFALAVPPGTVSAGGPVLAPESSPSSYTPPLNAKFKAFVRLTNSGDLAAHNCVLTISLPAGVTLVSGSLSHSLGTIDAGSSSDWIELWLKATTTGTKTVNMSANSSSYGITDWSGSGAFTITPGPADTIDPYSVLVVGQPTYQTSGTDKIANGGFESGLLNWSTSGTATVESGAAHSGSNNLRLGSGSGSAYQTISVASGAGRAFLTFWYKSSASLFASAGCSIQNSSGNTLVYPLSTISSYSSWTKFTADVSRFKGQTIRVNFYSSSGIFFGNSTLWVDDVSVKENEAVWVDSTNAHTIAARDDNSGIDYSQYAFGADPWTTYSSAFNMSGKSEGWNNLYYRSLDNGSNYEPTISTGLYLDSEAPKSVLNISGTRVFNGGAEKAANGGFESNLTGWTTSGVTSVVTSPVYNGSKAAKIGETGAGSIYQDVAISAGASRAIASAWVRSTVGSGSSYAALYVIDPVTGLYSYSVGWNFTSGWTLYTWDVTRYRGSTVRLRFDVVTSSGGSATLYVDDVTVRENSNLYVLPTTAIYIYSAERCGVQKYEHKVDSESYMEGQLFTVAGPGLHTMRYRALDNLNHQESDVLTEVYVDNVGPSGSLVIDGGAVYTTSIPVTLTIDASDLSGVTQMRIKNQGGAYTAWEPYATTRVWALTAGAGTKTVVVQFADGLGNLSAEYSDEIRYMMPTLISTIGQAKQTGPYPVAVTLSQKIVTGIFHNQRFFYIQESDRSSGIRVYSDLGVPGLVEGQIVSLDGVLRLSAENEPELYWTDYAVGAVTSPLPRPLGANNRATGGGAFGAFVPGTVDGNGLHSVGLLWRAWGRIIWRSADGYRIRIDDGSGIFGGGLLVDTTLYGPAPSEGKHVGVTGNLGTTVDSLKTVPLLRLRNRSDLNIY